jgi:hypothetical protein
MTTKTRTEIPAEIAAQVLFSLIGKQRAMFALLATIGGILLFTVVPAVLILLLRDKVRGVTFVNLMQSAGNAVLHCVSA